MSQIQLQKSRKNPKNFKQNSKIWFENFGCDTPHQTWQQKLFHRSQRTQLLQWLDRQTRIHGANKQQH